MKHDLAVFEGHEIRRHYDEATETWWFSVVDIIRVLTEQADFKTARKYWNQLKERLTKEGSQLVTSCHQLKCAPPMAKVRARLLPSRFAISNLSQLLCLACALDGCQLPFVYRES
ncbi:MAG: hypothetical protein ACLQSR_09270 [Limisphaerales bacterium]